MTRKLWLATPGSRNVISPAGTREGNVSILLLRQIGAALDIPPETSVMDGPEPLVDLVHTMQFFARLSSEDLAEARGYWWNTSAESTSKHAQAASRSLDCGVPENPLWLYAGCELNVPSLNSTVRSNRKAASA